MPTYLSKCAKGILKLALDIQILSVTESSFLVTCNGHADDSLSCHRAGDVASKVVRKARVLSTLLVV